MPALIGPSEGPWICIGGGNDLGKFTESTLQSVIDDMDLIPAAGYSGIVYDVEAVDGPSSTMVPLF
jgi:hypothetical protein